LDARSRWRGALGTIVLLGAIELWMVFVVALGFGVLTALDNPARMAFIPEMVGPGQCRIASVSCATA
jgi:hypothetical protein